jgi:hypothetical protein
VVAGEVDLQLGVARVLRGREALHHLLEGLQRPLGELLVAADVDDLLVVAEPLQVVGVVDVRVRRVELDEPVEGVDGVGVLVGLVLRVGRHQLRLGRPDRVRVLALDLVEQRGGLLEVAAERRVVGLVVDLLDRTLHVGRLVGRAAGGQRCEDQRGERDKA